ncbi:D-arabinono-1,4-lactone oxidase [Blastococcus xanthinilyticus]|uniref:L-gulonolactone oxidase n=1 Tax=Blastococcus xanthinilyticus TaxID=1564164 RepID=A0A5S5CQV6_9ACTN|nr:D-arabinono-1,4-lactone oxidase [Blastococcus xanthinilyticus]TYP82813.1 L-gulonolactone oxidase [Blastococcus xanthinilyticus]
MVEGLDLSGPSRRWRNWAGNQRADVPAVQPASADEVAHVLTTAAAAGRRVRPIGSGHSFSAIGLPDDVQLGCGRLAGIRSIEPDGRVTVGAGTTLHRLGTELLRRGWSLTNLGDIDRQTVAGALATGTHGTGARFGGLATQVRGLELVLPSGEVLDCDAQRHPEVFGAARVGLGALGVVTAVTLQAEPAFALRAVEGPGTLAAALEGFEELMTSADHVEFYWFPHTDATLLKCNTRLPLAEGLDPLPRWRAAWDDEVVANAAFAGVVAAGRRVPALVPPLARFSARALGRRAWTDHAHRVFVSRRRVRFLEMEYAVPRSDAPAVLAELRRVHEAGDWRTAFPVEVRLAAADDVPLSPAVGRDVAWIAAHVPARTEPGRWFDALESIAGEVGGRPHWGKLHGLDAAALRARYPRFDEFVALRDRLDPAGVLTNGYLDRVLGPGAHR